MIRLWCECVVAVESVSTKGICVFSSAGRVNTSFVEAHCIHVIWAAKKTPLVKDTRTRSHVVYIHTHDIYIIHLTLIRKETAVYFTHIHILFNVYLYVFCVRVCRAPKLNRFCSSYIYRYIPQLPWPRFENSLQPIQNSPYIIIYRQL